MVNPEIDRDLGRHDAEITQLKDDMKSMKEDVHEIKLMLAKFQGGWGAIMLIAGASATLGAIVAKFIPWFSR